MLLQDDKERKGYKSEKRDRLELEKSGKKPKPVDEDMIDMEDASGAYQRAPKDKPADEGEPKKLVIPKVVWEFTKELEDKHVKENEFAEFTCSVSNKNVPVKWYIGENEAVVGPKVQIFHEEFNHRLAINKAKPEDEGQIKCTFKKCVTTANLTVEGNQYCNFTHSYCESYSDSED